LEPASPQAIREADIRARARVIEETLASFGVPARVVSINQGPTVTQFGVEPGFIERRRADGTVRRRKVRVSRITALADDLALALAAAPIRIEAPVPGQPVVGIEVPNRKVSLVSLRSVIESEAFQEIDSPLKIALGQDVSGEPVAADLALMPHLLIAGATGSGKSVCINSIITCLLMHNPPETLKLLLVDPKRVELVNLNGIPHLLAPVVTDLDEVVSALYWATQEMERRFELFARAGVRNIEVYNRKATRRDEEPLPYLVVIIDELADLMMVAPDEVERLICRLAQLARATGIHLVIATQRPSVDVVTGLIKANFPARISFAVASQVDSRVILDMAGAEKLLGRGDMLFMSPDAAMPQRLQGCYVSDKELNRLVRFWRRARRYELPDHSEEPPWEGLPSPDEAADELLQTAIELVQQHRRASASFLQRRLHIGYPRAARLIDQLEEMGIVGPPAGPGQSREVIIQSETAVNLSAHPGQEEREFVQWEDNE
jgi:S-DNA-T family DNA segregation ATPase FtsK/SpoIIIE